MEIVTDVAVKNIIREELERLGIEDSPPNDASKKSAYSVKLLTKTAAQNSNRYIKNKKKDFPFPSTPVKNDNRKNSSKSPFSNSKHRSSVKKKKNHHVVQSSQVFGQVLSDCKLSSVILSDSLSVNVPSFLIDSCNVLRRNITLEGIFRKAGSASRQNDIKRIIDSGGNLPSTVHPIDAACLLKQFFRCLPEPLLESSVHSRMMRCHRNDQDQNANHSAIILCTFLLPSSNQHVLIYFLNFLNEVVENCSKNKMDAHNLAVVLAPNMMPMNLSRETSPSDGGKKKGASSNSCVLSVNEDRVLSANIEILEVLIQHHDRVCRLPSDVIANLKLDKVQQMSDGVDASAETQPLPKSNKKRRSTSVHWLVSSIRRVVGGPSPPSLQMPVNSPHPLSQHRIHRLPSPSFALTPAMVLQSPLTPAIGGISLHPKGAHTPHIGDSISPVKRKSDALESDDMGVSERDVTCSTAHPPKKAKVTDNSEALTPKSYAAVAATANKTSPRVTFEADQHVFKSKVRRVQSARKSVGGKQKLPSSAVLFPRHLSLATFLDNGNSKQKRKRPEKLGKKEPFVVYPYLSKDLVKINTNISSGKSSPIKKDIYSEWTVSDTKINEAGRSDFLQPLHKSQSEVIGSLKSDEVKYIHAEELMDVNGTPSRVTPVRRASISGSVNITPQRSGNRASKRQRRRTRQAAARQASCALLHPAEVVSENLNNEKVKQLRGSPDGAESEPPKLPEKKSSKDGPMKSLEEQYVTIKSAVDHMEMDFDCDNMMDMRESSVFGQEVKESLMTLNHNEIIQTAYEKIQKESGVLGISPSEHLSRRLDRELKIRRRRSGEDKVCRSPSERRIGTMRRRSKELEQKQLKTDSPKLDPETMTPRIKPSLMRSPLTQSLKKLRTQKRTPVLLRSNTDCTIMSPMSSRNKFANFNNENIPKLNLDDTSVDNCSDVSGISKISYSDVCKQSDDCNSVTASPGSMSDHILPSVSPGSKKMIKQQSFTANMDFENENWKTAGEFLDQELTEPVFMEFEDENVRRAEDGNRPSIAALKKQKKVTANVQLFNQLGVSSTPRRNSRMATPQLRPMPQSERKAPRNTLGNNRAMYRASLTPRQFLNKNKQLRVCEPAAPNPKIAIVKPLRENRINTLDLSSPKTPRGTKPINLDNCVFKTPNNSKIRTVNKLDDGVFKTPTSTLKSKRDDGVFKTPTTNLKYKHDDGVFKTPGFLTPVRMKQNKQMKISNLHFDGETKTPFTDTYI